MDLKTKLETTTKNHEASIQNIEAKFDRLANKQSARPSGSLPSNTQLNPQVMLLQDENNPGTTMEEYVQFETKKAHRKGPVYNWETAIVYDDALKLESGFSSKPILESDINLESETSLTEYMTLPPRAESNVWLRFDDQDYDSSELRRQVSWRQFILVLGLHTTEEMDSDGFGAYYVDSLREIASKANFRNYWISISFVGDFLSTVPSYTLIREPLKRLYHRLIAFSIARRSQAPKKVTTTDIFFLRSIDEGTVVIMEKCLQKLTVEVRELTIIDIDKLEDVPVGQEGVQADPSPM
ncbi:hypothetical protein Tco_0536520 [Tanacetum coccineum]